MAYVLLSLLASIRSRQKRSLPAAPGSGVVSLAGKRYSLIWSRSEVVVAWGRAAPLHNSLHRSRRACHLGLQATNQSRCPQCRTPQPRMDPVLGGDLDDEGLSVDGGAVTGLVASFPAGRDVS